MDGENGTMQPGHGNTIDNGTFAARMLVTRRRALGLALVAGAGSMLLAACGTSATATSAPTAAARSAGTAGIDATPTAAAIAPKVNANTASKAELTAAFQAAGIPSPDRWAQEVTEYRPYPTDDPTFAKLRSNLAKYKPAPGVVDQIVATLRLT
jgi:membrane-bound lytic murein transglycosylase B